MENNPILETETFEQSFTFDAMNRTTTITQPDNSLTAHSYNKAGLLESIKTQIRGDATWSNVVTNINYNEKGQRTEIYYDNGSKTKYTYDEKTFRLNRLLTTRNTGSDILQDINYIYDPEGNITEIEDNAQQTFYYSNSVIEPRGKYYYDALYRLTKATGRELSALAMPTHTDFANNIPVPNTASNAMANYTQQYSYDELGNIHQMQSLGNWTRDYYYETTNNRLKNHDGGSDVYSYDAHGNTTAMPHLATMNWDYKDQLHEVNLGGGGTAYYTYDASGERTRKVIVKTGGIVEQRIYLGGWEVYRKSISGTLDFERETLRISDERKAIVDIETKTVENGSNLQLPTSNLRYQYDNHIGSASLELDSTAAIISYEEYHPFGTTSYRSGRTETEVSLKRYKYVGKERDEETGLYYYGVRYYAGWIARFISVDPLQHKYPHYTPYQYAGNKPVSYIDLDGLEEAKPDEHQKSTTNKIFHKGQIQNLDKYIQENISKKGQRYGFGENDRHDCITTVINAIRVLYRDRSIQASSPMSKQMMDLQKNGLVGERVDFHFLDNKGKQTTGITAPVELEESIGEKMLSMSDQGNGHYVFGLSLADDYHTATIVVNVVEGKATYDFKDQNINFKNLNKNSLDSTISKYVIDVYKTKKYKAKASIWQYKNIAHLNKIEPIKLNEIKLNKDQTLKSNEDNYNFIPTRN